MEYPKFKVCCRCYTFNQSKYITDALNGFTMQQTDFPFVCTIVDDASTDGEQDVIRKYVDDNFDFSEGSVAYHKETDYAHITYAQHKTNKNCYFAVLYLKENLYSKKMGYKKLEYISLWRDKCEYEAPCEGDDYWTDSLKLQMQADFLEKHRSHSMCFHAVDYLYPNGEKKTVERYGNDVESCNIEDAISEGGSYAKLNSMLIRLSMFKNGFKEWASNCPVGDLPSILTLFVNGKVSYIHAPMSVYRCDAVGSWTTNMDGKIKKLYHHYKRMSKMWRNFDVWTKKMYHKSIMKKMKANRNLFLKGVIAIYIHGIKRRKNGK